MQHIGSLILAFASLTAAVPGLAPASVRSAKSAHVRRDTSSFQIYAYGSGIGGLALFTAGGKHSSLCFETHIPSGGECHLIFVPSPLPHHLHYHPIVSV